MATPPRTAVAIARAIKNGEMSARDVVDQSLAAIDAREGEIGAFNLVTAEQARARADEIDTAIARGETLGPLAGVPIAIKDNMCTRGIETTCSSRILEGWKPPYDATVITRLRDAGAVFVGKTNLDEFAMGSSTENSAFGITRNPVDTSRVPGGSSGGSAAAVAAGFTPVSLGSDTGGSIRQPAAMCGVVGVKPTYGLVSRLGLVAYASSLDQIGPFATTVEDAALVLEAIAGHDPMDSTSIPQPAPSLVGEVSRGVAGMRIGRVVDLPGGAEPEVSARLEAAFAALTEAGAEIVDVTLPSLSYALTAYYVIAPAEASSNLARFDGVMISPGPGRPEDAGNSIEIIQWARHEQKPLLGVCLGHQAIADAFGGAVGPAERLIHGATSTIEHDGVGLFQDVPQGFKATRYHSLAVTRMPADLIITARSDDGEVMALRDEGSLIVGVQFHPESILTEHGHLILRNWLASLASYS